MSTMHNPYRLYEFLPPKAIAGKESGEWQLLPGIMDSVHYLAEIVASKEIIEEGTPWDARLHHYDEADSLTGICDDPEKISESYMAHLGSSACEGRRTFEFDRPLSNSPTGASNLRLEVSAPPDKSREGYIHTITTYSPLSEAPQAAPKPFDEDEYLHMKELMASGQFEAWELQQAELRAQAVKGAEPLPTIPYPDINSQFIFRTFREAGVLIPRIYTATFKPGAVHNDLARVMTPIDADHRSVEAAYHPNSLPTLTHGQNMVRQHVGAHALIHHNLSLALRHLTGDMSTVSEQIRL